MMYGEHEMEVQQFTSSLEAAAAYDTQDYSFIKHPVCTGYVWYLLLLHCQLNILYTTICYVNFSRLSNKLCRHSEYDFNDFMI